MKEIKKKVTIAYEYGKNRHKADVYGKTWEELFNNLMYYANDENKIAILMPVETVEVEEKEEEYDLDFKADWGKQPSKEDSNDVNL